MKKYLLLLMFSASILAQAPQPTGIRTGYIIPYPSGTFTGVANRIGFGTTTPAGAFDFTSTIGGIVPPRVTTTQKNAISSPAIGTEVFDTTLNLPQWYNGTIWTGFGAAQDLNSVLTVGNAANTKNAFILGLGIWDPIDEEYYKLHANDDFLLQNKNGLDILTVTNQGETIQLNNQNTGGIFSISAVDVTNNVVYKAHDKADGEYYILTEDDASGFLPYTGATSDVDLNNMVLSNVHSLSVNGAITGMSFNSVVLSGSATPNLSVTGTAVISGSNTGDETTSSIQTKLGFATTALDGYLKATDWNTFNNKQGSISLTTTGTGAASFASNVLNIPTPDFSPYLTSSTAASTYFPLIGGSITGTGGNGFVGLIPQSSTPATPVSGVRIFADSAGGFSWIGVNGFYRKLSFAGLTQNTTATFPNVATGTVAYNDNTAAFSNKDLTSGTNTFPTFNQNTTGSAAKWTTGRAISITGDIIYTSPSVDGTANVTAAGTLATVNANVGSFGSATQVPSVTFDGKGRVTAVSNVSITAPAGTLTGTTLASNVVNSSLTGAAGGSFGTAAYSNSTSFEVPLTFSTGLTRTTNTITVNTSQNIAKLSNLTTNGFVKTSSSDGSLSVDTNAYVVVPTGSAANVFTMAGTYIALPGAVQATVINTDTGGTNTPILSTNTFRGAVWTLQAEINGTLANISVVNTTSTAFTSATLNSTYPNVPVGYTVICPNIGTGMRYYKVTEAGTSDVWHSNATSNVP